MSYIKYQTECNECDTPYTVFVLDKIEEEPLFCPFCGAALLEENEDEGEE